MFFKVKDSAGSNEKVASAEGRGLLFRLQTLFSADYKQFHGVKSVVWKLAPAPAQKHKTNDWHSSFLDCPLDLQACLPLTSLHSKTRVYVNVGFGPIFTCRFSINYYKFCDTK